MSDSLPSGYTIERLDAKHAAGVTQLVQAIYDDSYYPRTLYDPDEILRLNEMGHLVSIVALDAAGSVVGHYALERPPDLSIAEASDAIVLPEHRHHHLMERMREALRDEANRLALEGLVGYPVTNHLFSQKAENHVGAHPCGLALGLWPRSFHNMPDELPQRMSFVIYFKYLQPLPCVSHVRTHHRDMLARISQQYAIEVVDLPEERPTGTGKMTVIHETYVGTATIQVNRVGANTAADLADATRALCDDPAVEATTLELPLAQPGAAEIARIAEDHGFFFCGLGPAFAVDGDALLLQLPKEKIDVSLLQIENPFTIELLAYIQSERERVGAKGLKNASPAL